MTRTGIRRAVVKVAGEHFLLRDRFHDLQAAGSVDGKPAIPGPGTRLVVDTGNNLAVTGGEAVASGIVGAADPRLGYSDPIARVAGRTLKWICRWVSARSGGGWCLNNNPASPAYGVWEAAGILGVSPPSLTGYPTHAAGFDYTLWASLFATGAAVWTQGGGGAFPYTNPTLLWVSNLLNTDPMYVFPIIARAAACDIEVDDIEVVDQPNLSSAEQIATVYQANPISGVGYVSHANALHYLRYTLPGGPIATDDIGIHYRKSDAANYWHAYIEYDGAAWDFNLDRVVAGVPNNHINVLGIGDTISIAVIATGNDHYCFTRVAAGGWTKRGATITNAFNNTDTEIAAVFDAGTISRLESYAREWTI